MKVRVALGSCADPRSTPRNIVHMQQVPERRSHTVGYLGQFATDGISKFSSIMTDEGVGLTLYVYFNTAGQTLLFTCIRFSRG
jgi:hypothetical protein